MRVQFDLRPIEMVEKERKKTGFNFVRVLAILLMMTFFVSTISYLVIMGFASFGLRERIDEVRNTVNSVQAQNANLQGQINLHRAQEAVYVNALAIMNDDLPTIEVLGALETFMDPFGLGFSTLSFQVVGGAVIVNVVGEAASDRQIIEYSERLRLSGVFSQVNVVSTALIEATGMISFTMRMPVRSIGEITSLRAAGGNL